MKTEFIVATKEFKDYLMSKRFLIIFAALVLMCIAAIISGISTYNASITEYNSFLSRANSASAGMGARVATMPSMLVVFESFGGIFTTIGWLLAIAVGFDLISKEKETGSLKLLLSRPTFRDSVINGKILGSSAILVVALAATFVVALAILLFSGLVPTGDDLLRLIVFFLAMVLFCVAFLAIAMAASTVAKNSTLAVLIAIGIVMFSTLLPTFTGSILGIVMGSAPQMTLPSASTSDSPSNSGSSGTVSSVNTVVISTDQSGGGTTFRNMSMTINPAYTSYWNTRNQVTEAIDLLSPTQDFTGIINVVVDRQSAPLITDSNIAGRFTFGGSSSGNNALGNTLPSVLPQALALLVMILGGFALSYIKFMRMDVR
jgi:ABC-2 type transport system permease protein